MPVQTAIQVRRGTASSWTSTNPTLAAGEIGFETDTSKFKIGTGSTAWNSLNYFVQDPVTTKGDLYTFSTTDTRLAVGNNGETLVADSSTSTGLRWQGLLASGRNFVTNGSADIWQRGTSFTIGTNRSYTADRWECLRGALVAGLTVSRQTVSDSTNLPFVQYSIRLQRDSGNTSTQSLNITQNLETIDSIPLAGRTVTLSFYARVGANYSGSGASVSAIVVQGTGTDQNLWNGYTGQSTAFQSSITPTTTWTRYSVTGSIASTSTQVGFYLSSNPTGTAGANDWIEYTGLQLEVGSVATPFRRAGGNIAGELAACRRYLPAIVSSAGNATYVGMSNSTTSNYVWVSFDVPARVNPTGISRSALTTFTIYNPALSSGNPTAVNFDTAGLYGCLLNVTHTAGSPTTSSGNAMLFRVENSGSILFTGCEL